LAQEYSIDQLKKKTEEIGKLKFKQAVPIRYLSKTELDAYVARVFAAEYPDDLAKNETDFALMMGFFKTPIDIKEQRRQILLDNVGGLYNESSKEMLIPSDFRMIDQFSALALVHEFRHAIQDQHFSLKGILGTQSDFHDARLAALAAVEGDAYFCMLSFFEVEPVNAADSVHLDSLSSFISFPGTSSILNSPPLLQKQLLMPYIDGVKFASAIYRKGKWEGLNQMLKNPPVSSEQILHPEKYFKREMPVSVQIDCQPDPHVWGKTFSGVVGEYYLNILLNSGDEPPDAAKGWGGDSYNLFRKDESLFFIWESHWDSETDASRFFYDFRRFLEAEFQFSFQYGEERGQIFQAGQGSGHYFFLRKDKNRLFYVRTNQREAMNTMINGGIYD